MSPGHVKWPHLRKNRNARHSYTEWLITLQLSAIGIRNCIYKMYTVQDAPKLGKRFASAETKPGSSALERFDHFFLSTWFFGQQLLNEVSVSLHNFLSTGPEDWVHPLHALTPVSWHSATYESSDMKVMSNIKFQRFELVSFDVIHYSILPSARHHHSYLSSPVYFTLLNS